MQAQQGWAWMIVLGLVSGVCGSEPSSLLDVDYRSVVSRADLIYQTPARTSVEGLPIGNGVMGTLVWTSPSAIHFQINRIDVFSNNKDHKGGWTGGTAGACASITVELAGRPPFEWSGKDIRQRLSLYDAEVSIAGNTYDMHWGQSIRVRCFISAVSDVLVLEVVDERPHPKPLRLTVSDWKSQAEIRSGDNVARRKFADAAGKILLEQQFEEEKYFCSSAVAAQVVGVDTPPEVADEMSRTIVVPAKKGPRTILISSAAARSPQEDVGAAATKLLDQASRRTYDDLHDEHARWWAGFWSRSTFVHITSSDGIGEFMERVRTLHLYNMAATSRGPVPPKYNGSIFTTRGGPRRAGNQYWMWTTETIYWPLYVSDAIDLTEPFFKKYLDPWPARKVATKQRWGVEGVVVSETEPFDGPVVLPDDVAREFQDVHLGRKKNEELSERAYVLCNYDEGLKSARRGALPFRVVSHIVSSGSELAMQAWWRYRYTGDKQWLRHSGYQVLRDTVEFYRNFVRKGDDGRYHLYRINAHEAFCGINDSIIDLAAIRGTAPLAIRAAEILDVDADLRTKWQELLDNLAPYPMGDDPEARGVLADDLWAIAHKGPGPSRQNYFGCSDFWLTPVFPFEAWTLETRDARADRIVQRLVDLAPKFGTFLKGGSTSDAIRTPIVTVRAGRGDQLPTTLAATYNSFKPLANGFSLFEGSWIWKQQAHSIEHLGVLTMTLQEALLQSVSAHPGEPEVLSVFPAWPKQWAVSFRLLARGGFLVTSVMRNGQLEFVEIQSRLGETCRLRNPWGQRCVVTEVGSVTKELTEEVLVFDTVPGGVYRVLRHGAPKPVRRRIAAPAHTQPASFRFKLPNGKVAQGTLGIK